MLKKIEVRYDPKIEFEPIEDPMYATSKEENGEVEQHGLMQTAVTGIISPLIKINNILIPFNSVTYFEMDCKGILPHLRVTVNDNADLIKSIDRPKNDNLLRLQILPPFDNAYKKINMNFYITGSEIEGDRVSLSCVYKVPELYRYRLESMGRITTYGMADHIARDCALGLASDIEDTDDERYIYCRNENYITTISKNMQFSGTERLIPDMWVDWFNYLNIVNIYNRYREIDDDPKVWIMDQSYISGQSLDTIQPIETEASISNSPTARATALYISSYEIRNNASDYVDDGTDKIVERYGYVGGEPVSTLIQDGDIHSDIYPKTYYDGEVFGPTDYFLQRQCRRMVLQKINGQCISVTLSQPCLGMVRGSKVNLYWYDTNDVVTTMRNNDSITSNIPLDNLNRSIDGIDTEQNYVINKQISGQYYIIGTRLLYENMKWQYKLLLGRPADLTKSYTDANADLQ